MKTNVSTLPTAGFAIEIDGRIKSEFETMDGAATKGRLDVSAP